ncbi:hypothetical protein [Thalassotalea marina]|uniref:START domain-containing protein n=1 Tax=Thalassotalea marina TaxID=1673741 RepID=A0A919BSH1_9GAMM|nr:hypothetical protein [Thalassotalea marina]GHG07583.1 hypothetical protein GCM10017161_41580 [Thalassotalea marina]
MKKISSISALITVVISAIYPSIAKASCDDINISTWQLWRSNNNYSVHFAQTDISAINALKANIKLNTSIEKFYQFLNLEDNVLSWLDRASKVDITQIDNKQSIITTYFDGFFVVSPRVMSAKSTITLHSSSTMKIAVENSPFTPPDDTIAMTMEFGCWSIIKTSEHTISVSYQFLANPNGDLPNWMVNNLAKKSLWKSLENLHRQFPVHYTNEK